MATFLCFHFRKHMETFSEKKVAAKKYYCEKCDYYTDKKSNFSKHILTTKHSFGNIFEVKSSQSSPTVTIIEQYSCVCGSKYKTRGGLWKHKKVCKYINGMIKDNSSKQLSDASSIDENKINDVIIKMVKSNQELQDKVIELCKGQTVVYNNNITNNNCNQQFNLQLFLQETCKNAMNITDFVDSLQIETKSLDKFGKCGYVQGISDIFIDRLKELNEEERPLHCTDKKRETLYIKDNDVWEKDNELMVLLNGIKSLSLKQRTSLNKWQEANHGWNTDENLQSKMTKLIFHSMTNVENDEKETNKIIRAIGKSTYLTTCIKESYK